MTSIFVAEITFWLKVFRTVDGECSSGGEWVEEAVGGAPGHVAHHVHHQQAEPGDIGHVHVCVGAVAGTTRPYVHHLHIDKI